MQDAFFVSRKFARWSIVLCGLFTLYLLCVPLIIISWGKARITTVERVEQAPVVIVFGAGLTRKNVPSSILNDRLLVAANLFRAQKVSKILVSGDNRVHAYNEPQVMMETLVSTFGIPSDVVVTDFGGRRTFDTCVRAKNIFGVDQAILVTQGFHLPRALWLCHHLGVDVVGVQSTLQPYRGSISYKIREIVALWKAWIDIYLWEPSYIGGDTLMDLDQQ